MLSSSWGWEKRDKIGGERALGRGAEEMGNRAEEARNWLPGLSCSAPPSEWPLCCTRPAPPTATGLGVRSMHRWKRGPGSPCPCPWGTRVSGQPLCMCWGTSCRALGYWPPPSSSTSRYCPSPASQNPQPPSPDCSSQLPRTPAWPSPLSSVLRASQDLFVRDAPRHSSGRSLVPGLRGSFPTAPVQSGRPHQHLPLLHLRTWIHSSHPPRCSSCPHGR